RRPTRRLAVRKHDAPVQIQAIAVGEFAQSVEVDRLQQRGGVGVDRIRVDADLRGYRRLVIADTGYQVQQPQRAFDCNGTVAVQRERRTGDGDRLNQLGTVVEGVDQFRHA